jgi:dihydropteroate synthase
MREALRAKRDAFLAKLGCRPVVMGILNITPDSFSDGGRYQDVEHAVAHAKTMAAAGCDIVDVGGESTRPGATALSANDELARIEPVVARLDAELQAPVSIDTYKAAVAARATELGAILVNDVWGLQRDPAMADVVAQAQAALVIMHNRADKDETIDILADMQQFFDRSLALAAKAGILEARIILDIGIAFGKTARQNRDALRRIAELKHYGRPILVGLSRKKFLGSLSDGSEATLCGTLAANLAAAAAGADIFRVHDVAEHVAALRVFQMSRGAGDQ